MTTLVTEQNMWRLRRDFLAPVMTASLISCVALGCCVMLSAFYCTRFVRRDRTCFAVLVLVLTTFAILDTIFEATFAYDWAVVHFGDWTIFSKSTWRLPAYCITGSSVCIVQLAFAHRVWLMAGKSKRGVAPVVHIIAGALAGLGCILRCGAFFIQNRRLMRFWQIRDVLVAWLVILVVVDVLITASVTYFLVYKPRRDSAGLLEPNARVTMLATVAARTNILCLVLQSTTLGLILAYPRAFHFLITSFLLSKCYTGSLVFMLNMRDPSNLSNMNSPVTAASPSQWMSTGPGGASPSQWMSSDPANFFTDDVLAAAEEGRKIPLSVVLALEDEEQAQPKKKEEEQEQRYETKLSLGRSAGKNVSFCPSQPLRTVSALSSLSAEGSEVDLGTIDVRLEEV